MIKNISYFIIFFIFQQLQLQISQNDSNWYIGFCKQTLHFILVSLAQLQVLYNVTVMCVWRLFYIKKQKPYTVYAIIYALRYSWEFRTWSTKYGWWNFRSLNPWYLCRRQKHLNWSRHLLLEKIQFASVSFWFVCSKIILLYYYTPT